MVTGLFLSFFCGVPAPLFAIIPGLAPDHLEAEAGIVDPGIPLEAERIVDENEALQERTKLGKVLW